MPSRVQARAPVAIFLFVSLLLLMGSPISAGSKKPNPAALQKAAGQVGEEQAAIQKETDGLLRRLATDSEFAKNFDHAAYKGDRRELARLIAAAGVSHKFVIEKIDRDLYVRIKIYCSRSFGCSIIVIIRW